MWKVVVCLLVCVSMASAGTVTLTPDMAPSVGTDQDPPRVVNDAPPGFGPSSWQNSATEKVNAYVEPAALFGRSVTIGEISSITYWTKAATGDENWYLNIYTVGPGDAGWYGKRFFNNGYTSYLSDGAWHDNSITSFERSSGGSYAPQTLAAWKSLYGDEEIRFFSPQTNSGIPTGNRSAQIDGMVIKLTGGEIGRINFEGAVVPLPAALPAGVALMGSILLVKYRRGRQLIEE